MPRVRAISDAEQAIDYYLEQAGEATALAFIDALEDAYAHTSRHPATGSLRYAHELDLPDLRVWPLNRFPYLIFYIDHPDHIDVWRILHGERDIPAWLQDQNP